MAGRFFSLGLLTPTLNCAPFQTKRLWRSMRLIRELSAAVSLRRKRIPWTRKQKSGWSSFSSRSSSSYHFKCQRARQLTNAKRTSPATVWTSSQLFTRCMCWLCSSIRCSEWRLGVKGPKSRRLDVFSRRNLETLTSTLAFFSKSSQLWCFSAS